MIDKKIKTYDELNELLKELMQIIVLKKLIMKQLW